MDTSQIKRRRLVIEVCRKYEGFLADGPDTYVDAVGVDMCKLSFGLKMKSFKLDDDFARIDAEDLMSSVVGSSTTQHLQ
ncbi:hypothetical protein A0H81_05594 [Grifola frondosa]|uniref:Uncharacterized protein n=1 Tax=Grifola frondosa TaxID=5627 RepID=A0A1C7MH17_GRIFR|nr:hypothetical protein A0H81_05594 [Grifola frondosa]